METSPGSGRAARLPGFPVAWSRRRNQLRRYMPVTVAGPRRTCTGFRKSPFAGTTKLVYHRCFFSAITSPTTSANAMSAMTYGSIMGMLNRAVGNVIETAAPGCSAPVR